MYIINLKGILWLIEWDITNPFDKPKWICILSEWANYWLVGTDCKSAAPKGCRFDSYDSDFSSQKIIIIFFNDNFGKSRKSFYICILMKKITFITRFFWHQPTTPQQLVGGKESYVKWYKRIIDICYMISHPTERQTIGGVFYFRAVTMA